MFQLNRSGGRLPLPGELPHTSSATLQTYTIDDESVLSVELSLVAIVRDESKLASVRRVFDNTSNIINVSERVTSGTRLEAMREILIDVGAECGLIEEEGVRGLIEPAIDLQVRGPKRR